MPMKKNDVQMSSLETFLIRKKMIFQMLGNWGCAFCVGILVAAALFFVIGMTLSLSGQSTVSIHAWAGPMEMMPPHQGQPSFVALFLFMGSLWGYLCLNVCILHRLFCAYKKGDVFNAHNTKRLIFLGLFNVFLCSTMAGLVALALAFVIPDTEKES